MPDIFQMGNKKISLALIVLVLWTSFCGAQSRSNDVKRLQALKPYLEDGTASEAQWLEAAMLYEHIQEFPEALYCLKRTAATFGTPGTDARVAQLVKTMGIQRYMLDDSGMQLRRWMAGSGIWVWIITLAFLLMAVTARVMQRSPRLAAPSMAGIAAAGILFLSWYHFLIPNYAVIIRPAAYYSGPGYGHIRLPEPAPAGSTVIIEASSDVWTYVDDGRREGWVPSSAIRIL